MSSADDDLPPLEDMSVGAVPPTVLSGDVPKPASMPAAKSKISSREEFEKQLAKTDFKTVRQLMAEQKLEEDKETKGVAVPKSKPLAREEEVDEELGEGEDNLQDALMAAALGKKSTEQKKEESAKSAAVTKDFGKGGGIKKGFLLGGGGGGAKKPAAATASAGAGSSKTDSSMPVIKADASKQPANVIPEVQEAMKRSLPPLLQDMSWLTPQLMEKMMKNPKLLQGLQNPKYMAALGEMQKDSKAAMAKYKGDAGFEEFLKAYMAMMGEHFTQLAEKEDKAKGKGKEKGEAGAKKGAEAPPVPAPKPASSSSKVLISELDDNEATTAAASVKPKPSAIGVGTATSTSRSTPDIGLTEASTSSVKKSTAAVIQAPAVDDIVDMAKKGEIQADSEVKAVLANKELMTVLADPQTQQMMQECARDGSRLRFYMGIPEMRRRLQMLEKHGLVKLM